MLSRRRNIWPSHGRSFAEFILERSEGLRMTYIIYPATERYYNGIGNNLSEAVKVSKNLLVEEIYIR
jgi:hypothetical protein